VHAYQTNQVNELRECYRSLNLLLIDDIQFIAGKSKTQYELACALNLLIEANKQVVITCDTPPNEISGIEPQLISRFNGGLIVAIKPPDLEMRTAIVLNSSAENNYDIRKDIAYFVAKNIRSDIAEDIRKLEGVLRRIVAFARFHNRTITVDLVKKALAPEIILNNICDDCHENKV
jgi:chromosomal replication initiator protein